MDEYKKVTETIQYTETVIYDPEGNEVYRERNYDDVLYDQESTYIDSDEFESEYAA